MSYWDKQVKIAELVGKTFTDVRVEENKERLVFVCADGSEYLFYHDQDCCEFVRINDINGDLAFLVGEPLLLADEATNCDSLKPSECADSWTWTFYRFGTRKGYVDVRWLGESNGYYGESVLLARTKDADEVPQ